MFTLILLIIGVIIFSGIFSGTEAAILNITPAEVEVMIQKRKRFATLLQYIKQYTNRAVTTVLILNNIVNIAGSILVGHMTVELFGSTALGIMTTAFTFGIIIFSEIIPKSIATSYARTVCIITAPFVVTTMGIFLPFIWPIEAIINHFFHGERTIGTEAQIRSLVRIGRKGGHIEQDEGQLIHRVFNLNDVTAKDIMTPRKQISALSENMTIEEATVEIIADPHSRFPVYGKNMNDIKGIILETEVLASMTNGNGEESLNRYIRSPLFVDENLAADDLLIHFRNEKSHMAIVQRKGKHTLGVVTLEDVLEELVGEIEDERD